MACAARSAASSKQPRAARATTGAQSLEAALTDLGGATRLAAACDQQDTSYCQRIVHVLQELGN